MWYNIYAVRRFFNPKPKGNVGVTGKSFSSSKLETVTTSNPVKDEDYVSGKLKTKIILKFPAANVGKPTNLKSDSHDWKKRKLQDFEVDQKKSIEADNLSKRPKVVKCSINFLVGHQRLVFDFVLLSNNLHTTFFCACRIQVNGLRN